ncbi:hypothetical protein [Paraburkholderia nemoris]|uniref:hypothetical protein n=1 Tax=Paraburkholderia nemoris TaxID=2793076 RepID=UPI001B1B7320|nr:hypothetical protein [Paraburkholderia nemoris]CAE6724628.1 hypothetical protein LMG22931_01897 [Paraburkholderia nemoris]
MTDATTIAIGSSIISLMSFAVSTSTMYFAWLRRGRLSMTNPALVFFGFDAVPKSTAKIFLRTLLYSTAAKGQVIESMYATLLRDGVEQTFSFWGYGETSNLTPGSGLYVGQAGVTVNHHFVLSVHQPAYEFVAGDYTIEVFARLVGKSAPIRLSQITVAVDSQHAAALQGQAGVLFELQPDSGFYIGHVNDRH